MRNDLDAALAEEIQATHTTYTLGFYLAENERDEEFHALVVQTRRPGLQLYYRQGYYAGKTDVPADLGAKTDKDDVESALLNQMDSKGVGITARVEETPGDPRGTLNIGLNLDTATLSLKEQGSGWTGKVEEIFVEQNENGNTLAKISDVKDFDIPAEQRAHYDSDGVAWPVSIPRMPGAVKITVIIRDSKSGRLGSLSVPLK